MTEEAVLAPNIVSLVRFWGWPRFGPTDRASVQQLLLDLRCSHVSTDPRSLSRRCALQLHRASDTSS